MEYRPEIDGLRAIAVLLVVAFHSGVFFSGGYIGVDIFFVISGYLITKIILKDLSDSKFTFAGFWARRIRRIVPALCAMLAFFLAAAILLFPNKELAEIGRTTLAATFSGSNFYFWLNTGYFAPEADKSPFLHTWSLGVEEQFYVCFPLLVVSMYRFGISRLRIFFALICIVSLLISIYCTYFHPSANFYHPVTRAWELLSGAIVATLPTNQSRSFLREVIGIIALSTLGLTSVFYTNETKFPGLAALPIIASTAIILLFANAKSFWTKLLGSAPLVFVGKISYSFYLWHWPFLVFCRLMLPNVTRRHLVAAVLLSFVMSILSFYLIEQPFRRPQWKRAWFVSPTGLALACLLLISVTGGIIFFSDGLPNRFPIVEETLQDVSFQNESFAHPSTDLSDLPKLGEPSHLPSFLVWGDSHASAFGTLFHDVASSEKMTGIIAAKNGCPPLPDATIRNRAGILHEMQIRNRSILENAIQDKTIERVFLVARWSLYVHGGTPFEEKKTLVGAQPDFPFICSRDVNERDSTDSLSTFRNSISSVVRDLVSANKQVIIFTEAPAIWEHPNPRAVWHVRFPSLFEPPHGIETKDFQTRYQEINEILLSMEDKNVRVIQIHAPFFRNGPESQTMVGNRSLYSDDDHISNFGASYLFRDEITEVLKEPHRMHDSPVTPRS